MPKKHLFITKALLERTKTMRKLSHFLFIIAITLLCSAVYGETKEEKIAKIKQEISRLQRELITLEGQDDVKVTQPELLVNVLFVDEYGHVPDCYKGVRVSDITLKGNHTHFLFDGKPINWDKKVVFSYQYTNNDVPIVGTIYHAVEVGGVASKVIDIPPHNVYQDNDGTIRYDDLTGKFPLAPKGSGYVITKCILPAQL